MNKVFDYLYNECDWWFMSRIVRANTLFMVNIIQTNINTVKYWLIDKTITLYSTYKYYFPETKTSILDKVDILTYDHDGNLCNEDDEQMTHMYVKTVLDGQDYFVESSNNNTEIYPNKIFLSCELTYDNDIIDIYDEFKQFLVTGNSFNKNFFKAFLKRLYNIDMTNDSKYTISCITNSCDFITFTEKDIISLET